MTDEQQLTDALPWLRRLARRLAGDEGDDLVHDTWLVTHRQAPQGGVRRIRPWLARAMKNRALSRRRSEIARERREAAASWSVPELPAPDARADENDVIGVLDEALAQLGEDDRAMLEQRFFAGKSAVEIGEARGMPAATVRTRIRRSLHKLRETLDERHGGERLRWTAAVAVLPVSPTKTGLLAAMTTKTKTTIAAGALIGLAAIAWIGLTPGDAPAEDGAVAAADDSRDGGSSHAASNADASPATPGEATPDLDGDRAAREAWARKRAAIEQALDSRRTPEADEAEEPAGGELGAVEGERDLPPPDDLVSQLAELGCMDMIPDKPRGNLQVQVNYVGAPDIGTVVESIDVLEDTVGAPELTECLTSSLHMLEFDPPTRAGRGKTKFSYGFGENGEVDQVLPLMKQFVASDPKLVAEYPFLQSVADLPDDAAVGEWLNEDFMRSIGEHPELAERMNGYIGERMGGDAGTPEGDEPR